MAAKKIVIWTIRLILLTLLYIPIWILGALAIGDLLPDVISEPGLVSDLAGMLILGTINTTLIVSLIVSSKWYGWRLMLYLALAYFGSFTFITQIETWYFLSELTISPELLPRLFIMGLTIPLIFIPIAVLVCKRWKRRDFDPETSTFDLNYKNLLFKLLIIAFIYLVIYWLAGYFIAWQNPELRAFYGSPGEITPFLSHTITTFSQSPDLVVLQLVRGILFVAIASPIILGSAVKPWKTAVLVAFLLAIPHFSHILANPLMPIASVRLSHMLETATSTFLFGVIMVWILYSRSKAQDLSSEQPILE